MANAYDTCIIDLGPLKLDREAIAKRLRVAEGSRKREELWEMIDTIEKLAKPAVHYRRVEPDFSPDSGVRFGEKHVSSNSVRNVLQDKALAHDDGSKSVFAFAATCGQEATDWGAEREYGLPVFWAQTILEEGMLQILRELENEMSKVHQSKISLVEPGVPEDWPLNEQTDVFEILGGDSEKFGIRLNEQSLMLPFKYLAGFAYFSKNLLPQCGFCHFTDCNKQRGGCWRLQAIKRREAEEKAQE